MVVCLTVAVVVWSTVVVAVTCDVSSVRLVDTDSGDPAMLDDAETESVAVADVTTVKVASLLVDEEPYGGADGVREPMQAEDEQLTRP